MNKFGALDSILAGFHYDLNFLTIHGKSRFPGLYVWTREGKKCRVAIPDGCLLVQAGKQIEYLTGGHVLAGFHEVVVNDSSFIIIGFTIDRRYSTENMNTVIMVVFINFAYIILTF